MQTGEYKKNRLLPEAVRVACEHLGVEFTTYSSDWILKLSKAGKTVWIAGYKSDVNGAAASYLAQDKVGTYEVLRAAGIPAVPHVLVRPVPSEPTAIAALQHKFTDTQVVVKPLNGTGGRGVRRYKHLEDALQFIDTAIEPAWAVCPYLDIRLETRLVVLNGEVVLVYEKHQPHLEHGVKFYNLSHGAHAVTIPNPDVSQELCRLAVTACEQMNLKLAAVDIVTLANGEQLVLEVNDGFSVEYYARQSAEDRERALKLYETIVAGLFL
jgi:glutathione synthase/RimK-type ligase-like ATP-grasp enzyme